ncbi:Glycosyltransferase involved in cell wall bisynthesis [Butyrivibrio hungatei DSM 14810]|uniref:4,4'-diaponeurosporenoate glycosyltransferase n=1 Tax=Butyrivibrio hungatei DSM 14810 TaxID=1121132 RepID=A0A1M7RY63_9FIRM|nr:glycosyltransferase [Butyrivibrio hungatei]SHN51074.1 Glycosyltransferase involved in cell wall bisynthesis [Butyrivibrio hungatei DSM 14810]
MIISIITICFNDIAGLKKTCESVISQNCHEYEHVIIDGGSEDGTKEYLRSLSNSKVVWKSEPDKGRSDAFNKGIKMSSGEYIICLNAGDYFFDENVVGDIVSDCKDNQVDAFCYAVMRKDGIVMHCKNEEYWREGLQAHQGLVLSRKTYDEIGGYNLILKNRMDLDLFLRLAYFNVSHRIINRTIAVFDTNGTSSYDKSNYWLEGALLKTLFNKELSYNEFSEMSNILSSKDSTELKGDDTNKKYALIYNWMISQMDGCEISKSLLNRGITTISIYGAGQLGSLLFKHLNDSKVEIKEIIDRKQGKKLWGMESISMDEMSSDVDAVIVTVIDDYEDIRKKILNKFHDIRVIALKDLVAGK